MVYLATSKLSITVLGNLGFAVALSMYKVMTKVCVLDTQRVQRSPMRIRVPGKAIRADEMPLPSSLTSICEPPCPRYSWETCVTASSSGSMTRSARQ